MQRNPRSINHKPHILQYANKIIQKHFIIIYIINCYQNIHSFNNLKIIHSMQYLENMANNLVQLYINQSSVMSIEVTNYVIVFQSFNVEFQSFQSSAINLCKCVQCLYMCMCGSEWPLIFMRAKVSGQ